MTRQSSNHENKVGNLNGRWSAAFKFVLAIGAPMWTLMLAGILSLQVWLVSQVHSLDIRATATETEMTRGGVDLSRRLANVEDDVDAIDAWILEHSRYSQ